MVAQINHQVESLTQDCFVDVDDDDDDVGLKMALFDVTLRSRNESKNGPPAKVDTPLAVCLLARPISLNLEMGEQSPMHLTCCVKTVHSKQ